MFMQDYDLVWDNHPGSQMGPADVLSHRDEVDTSLDNTAVTMLPTVSDILIRTLDVYLAERIAEFTATGPLVKDATDAMAKHSSLFPCVACDDWTFLTVPFTTRAVSMLLNQLNRTWYTLSIAPRQEATVGISALFTWFNAITGGLVLPPSFADLWLAALLAKPTRLTLT